MLGVRAVAPCDTFCAGTEAARPESCHPQRHRLARRALAVSVCLLHIAQYGVDLRDEFVLGLAPSDLTELCVQILRGADGSRWPGAGASRGR
jgi:hypothetical protein